MIEFEENDLIKFRSCDLPVIHQIVVEELLIKLLENSEELIFSQKVLEKYFNNKIDADSSVSIDTITLIHLSALLLATFNKKLIPIINTEGVRELHYKKNQNENN